MYITNASTLSTCVNVLYICIYILQYIIYLWCTTCDCGHVNYRGNAYPFERFDHLLHVLMYCIYNIYTVHIYFTTCDCGHVNYGGTPINLRDLIIN